MSGPCNDPDKPLDSLCVKPHAGHYCDSVVGQSPPSVLPHVQLFFLCKALNGNHPTNALCDRVPKRNHWRFSVEESWAGYNTVFQAYYLPLKNMTEFKYLGWIHTAMENYRSVVVTNLRKTRKEGWRMSSIMGRDGSDAQMSGLFYKSMVKYVLLFDSETWVVTHCIVRTLGVSHDRVAFQLTGKQYWIWTYGIW